MLKLCKDVFLNTTRRNFGISRRKFLCNKLVADMNKNSVVSAPENITIPYNLRSGAVRPITKLRRTKRTEDFFTFKYQ